ncbi:MAG: hypothetical protein RBT05_11020 [Bacteroidales bacterium]|jgi:hypothetical protein|nr:hypothetical protein [Bacteroidales bacterium]
MKIEPFKMKVTPEQSKKVQKILFAHGCHWYGHLKEVQCETEPYLYLGLYPDSDKEICFGTTEEYFKRQKDIKELTYEEFIELYDEKSMEKKIIGYRLAKPEYKKAASIIAVDCLCDFSKTFLIDTKPVEFWKKSKVLDLWFEPVYEEVEVILPFGKDSVLVNKDFAYIDGVSVDFYYISKLLDKLSSLPKIAGYEPHLHIDSILQVGCK